MSKVTIILWIVLLLVAGTAAAELVDGWNLDCIPDEGAILPYPSNYAIKYEPTQAYMLTGLEVWAGFSEWLDPDEFTVQIQTDFEGQPSGDILGAFTMTIPQAPPNWLGADFADPIMVDAGGVYWLVYFAMAWSPLPWCDDGEVHETWFSSDQVHWDPYDSFAWKARFLGDVITPTEDGSWSLVKSLY